MPRGIPPPHFSPGNWYWIVAGDPTQVYSSAAVGYVPVNDPTYVAWKALGGVPTKIGSEQGLFDILTAAGQPLPTGGSASDAQKDGMFDQIPDVIKRWAFAVDNRVRVLEGQPARTAAQFKNYVKGLM